MTEIVTASRIDRIRNIKGATAADLANAPRMPDRPDLTLRLLAIISDRKYTTWDHVVTKFSKEDWRDLALVWTDLAWKGLIVPASGQICLSDDGKTCFRRLTEEDNESIIW